MKKQKDGKNQDNASSGRRMGLPAVDSEVYGLEGTGRIGQENSTERDSTRSVTVTNNPGGDIGKILKRLEIVEGAFYQYVHAHQDRLGARLEESKAVELTFFQEVESLKKEILALAESEREEGGGDTEQSE